MSVTTTATSEQIRTLLNNASIEMTCKDTEFLAEAATLVPKNTDIFIALFPNQTWDDLTVAAKAVRQGQEQLGRASSHGSDDRRVSRSRGVR